MKAGEMKLNKSRKKINIKIEITQNSMELHLPFSNITNSRNLVQLITAPRKPTVLKYNNKKFNMTWLRKVY